MKTLYVTTFNKRLYDQSGHKLIESFLSKTINSDMLICYESFDLNCNSDKIKLYNIEKDEYMNTWINNNIDVIPKIYGGNADDNNSIFLEDKTKNQPWARYRTAGYFRKIVALNYAISNYSDEYDVMCVIDSDCIFKNSISDDIFSEIFDDGTSMFFYWGKYRKSINRGPETGFTGYCKKNNGYEFAKIICNSFITQDFMRFEFWDDGYVIGQLINENSHKFKLKDIVSHTSSRTTRVMEIKDSIFFNYVHHFKNRHAY